MRNKIAGLAALLSAGDIDRVEACKEIIEHSDNGSEINPNSAYLLYFRGVQKEIWGNLKKD